MNIEVKTNDWILPNRVGYNKYIYNTFHPSKYSKKKIEESCDCTNNSCELDSTKVSLFPQQRIIKDYMQIDSPYRGILLYHELGSGKSAASIAAAEGYINKKKVVIMTPASLSQNYENELMKISNVGLNLKKSWTCLKIDKKNTKAIDDLSKYAIDKKLIGKTGNIWVPLYNKDIDGAEILINDIKYTDLNAVYKEEINKTITHIIRNRYTFINYNGLTKALIDDLEKKGNPFDNTFIIIDEVHNFISRIANGSTLAMRIYNFFIKAKDIKMVLLSGTPIINQPYEIAFLINLLRGPMTTYNISILDGRTNKKKLIEKIQNSELYGYIDEIYISDKYINAILLPINYKRERGTSITKKEWEIDENEIIKRLIKKLNENEPLIKKIEDKKNSERNGERNGDKMLDVKKPYIIVTNGITGSQKTKLYSEIINYLKLKDDNVKIIIDDLVTNNKEYKKNVLEILNNVNRECNNKKICIENKYKNPDDKLLDAFEKVYFDIRNGKKCKDDYSDSCDKLNNLNLEKALKENKNIIFESQGLNVPSWLLSHPYLRETYNIIFGYSLSPIKKIVEVIISRAIANIKKYEKNPDKYPGPRFPNIDKTKIRQNIIKIIETLKYLRDKCIDDIKYIDCGNKKIDKLLIYNNKSDFKLDLIYDSKYNISEIDFENMIKNIVKIDENNEELRLSLVYKHTTDYVFPIKQEEFNKIFIDNKDPEDIKILNQDLFKRRILGILSYYKTTGSELFPRVLPERIKYMYMTKNQMKKYVDVRKKELDMDERKKKFAKRGDVDTSSVYRAFSRLVCNFAFPDEIIREFPQDIRLLKKKEISLNDNDKDNDDNYEVDINKEVAIEYELNLNKALKKLKMGNYLDVKNLEENYSPKFANMLDDINTSPGTVLVYSQFRVVEGLGIFKEVLNKQGYIEINITKSEEYGYIFDNPDVFDKKYDNKRYVVFNSDRVKTNILMKIFNGEFSDLPENIKNTLPNKGDNIDQRYGILAKVMMITQSGAEGISLKNVRRVLITEYFWNSVRIDQVIGRAVRSCSHMSLPIEDRDVTVYKYIMKFTKEQLASNPTIRKKDNELTTDQHILLKAQKKEKLIKIFLDMLKASSLDCVIHSEVNKPLDNGYKCYNWPININDNKLSYTHNIEDDNKIQSYKLYERTKKNKGEVVSNNGIKYILLNNKLYDYFSYKNAGVLISV
jgi:hypothetical protein